MSLVTQLRDGELGAWCAARCTGTPALAAAVDTATRGRRPIRPSGRVDPRHWAEIGGAFGLRLAALVEPAPPYYPLLGLVAAGLVSRRWADAQAACWPTHARLDPTRRARALELRPTPSGWLDLGQPPATAVTATPEEPVLAELLDRLRRYQAEQTTPGTMGAPPVEAGLARMAWLLSAFEDVYRTGAAPPELVALFGRPDQVPTMEAMRAAAPAPVVAELVELAGLAHTSGSLTQMRRLAGNPAPGHPLGHAAPVLVHHWADGDLLLDDGHAATLLDVKTVIRTDHPERVARWLWQLLGYAWLDVTDRWRIRRVGLYLARHGVLVTWSADELAARLLDEHRTERREQARAEFLALAQRALTAEGTPAPTT